MGSQVVANCASCHGTHSIFPSDPSPLHDQQRQSHPDLRTMSSRGDGEVHGGEGRRRCAALRRHRQPSGPLDSALLSQHDRDGDRRHVAAQPHHLALQDHCPAQIAARFRDSNAAALSLAACRSAHQFLHPCTHWIRIEVSRLVVRRAAGNERAICRICCTASPPSC